MGVTKTIYIRVGGGHDSIKERVRWWMGMEGRGEVMMLAVTELERIGDTIERRWSKKKDYSE